MLLVAYPSKSAGSAPGGGLRTTRACTVSELQRHAEGWRRLAQSEPMRSPEWLLGWWRHFSAPDDELCVLLFHGDEGALAGLAPLYIEVAGRRRTVRMLGSGAASTNHATWLAASGREQEVSLAAASFLLDLRPAWDCVELAAIDAGDPLIGATVGQLAAAGCLTFRATTHNCWTLPLPDSWERYLEMLSRTGRKRCRKLQREFLDSGRLRLCRVTSREEFARGFQVLLELNAARWGDRVDRLGAFSDQRFRRFHQEVGGELLERGQLHLFWLECDGRPVAVEYLLQGGKTVHSYLAGMDPAVTEFPPGNLSVLTALRTAIAEGYQVFDFSRGDQPYKGNWRATPSPCGSIRIWRDNPRGRLQRALAALRHLLEQKRMEAVRWVKARVSPRAIEGWRRVSYALTGRRRGPRKAGEGR